MAINYKFPAWDTKEDKDMVMTAVLNSIKEFALPLMEYKNGKSSLKSGEALALLARVRFLIGFIKALEYAKPDDINREIFDKIARLANAMDNANFEGMLGNKVKSNLQ